MLLVIKLLIVWLNFTLNIKYKLKYNYNEMSLCVT